MRVMSSGASRLTTPWMTVHRNALSVCNSVSTSQCDPDAPLLSNATWINDSPSTETSPLSELREYDSIPASNHAVPERRRRSDCYAVTRTSPSYTTRPTVDHAHDAITNRQTLFHATKRLGPSQGRTRRSDSWNSKDQDLDIRIWHLYSTGDVENDKVTNLFRMANDWHVRPEHILQCSGIPTPQKRPSPIPIANIRIPTKVPTDKHKWISTVRKLCTELLSVQRIRMSRIIFRDRPTWDSKVNIDVGNRVMQAALASTTRETSSSLEDGAARLTFAVFMLRSIVRTRKVEKKKRKLKKEKQFKNVIVSMVACGKWKGEDKRVSTSAYIYTK